MADIVEEEVWNNGIYQLETTDPVQGGVDGIDNLPHKALANRTVWLKAQMALKALINGSSLQRFKVAAAVDNSEAVNKAQLLAALENIDTNIVVEANNQVEEDEAFANGATIVIRLDLIGNVPVDGGNTPVLPNGDIQLLLHFDGDNNSTIFTDSSINSHNIVNISNAIQQTVAPKIGTANANFYITQSASGLQIADNPSLRFGTDDWTIEFWHKRVTLGSQPHEVFCSKGADGELNNAWYFGILSGTTIYFAPKDNSVILGYTYPYISDGDNWHHISLNREGTSLKLYVDGVMVANDTYVEPYEGTGALNIGRWNYGTANTQGGLMDEFVLFTGGVLRTENFTPPTAPIG
jgi:hypothetical protein